MSLNPDTVVATWLLLAGKNGGERRMEPLTRSGGARLAAHPYAD